MASAFGHALAAIALGTSFKKEIRKWKFWFLGIVCSIIPDADVVGFKIGIAYGSFWGHRGFTHSFVFAIFLGLIFSFLFYWQKMTWKLRSLLAFYFFLSTASHSILDAFTTGGLGVAFFSPFDNTRYFFPWRVIKVSPIGLEKFFSEWGIKVLMSEAFWIGIPSLVFVSIVYLYNLKRKT